MVALSYPENAVFLPVVRILPSGGFGLKNTPYAQGSICEKSLLPHQTTNLPLFCQEKSCEREAIK